MEKKPIIRSLMDNDTYKLNMLYFIVKRGFSKHKVGWEFFSRRENMRFPIGFTAWLKSEIANWCNLGFTNEELDFLWSRTNTWLDEDFIYIYLKNYKLDPSLIRVQSNRVIDSTGEYEQAMITFSGEWEKVILFEVMLLAAMNEIYSNLTDDPSQVLSFSEMVGRNWEKFNEMKKLGISFYEFGSRRRYSFKAQDLAIKTAIDCGVVSATSNLFFAMKYDIPIFGTMAHELFSIIAAIYGCESANKVIMGKWVETFHGNLGIALTDTYTTNHFLTHSFDHFYSKLFNGVREDSAPDPKKYVDTIIDHYKSLGIDPSTKTIVHSNGLSSVGCIRELQEYRKGEIGRQFGIGTFITNDVSREGSGRKLNNWVIKATYVIVNGQKRYCVKLSDTPGKVTSVDSKTVDCYKYLLGVN